MDEDCGESETAEARDWAAREAVERGVVVFWVFVG